MLLKPLSNIDEFLSSICHGTGRKIDRPVAKKGFSSKHSLQKIKKDGIKLFYKNTIFQ